MNLMKIGSYCITLANVIFLYMSHTNKICELKKTYVFAKPYVLNGSISKQYPFVAAIGAFKRAPNRLKNFPVMIGIWTIIKVTQPIPYLHCTATIISPLWLVTAAHCLIGIFSPFIMAGNTYTFSRLSAHYFSIEKIIPHKEFNKTGRLENDIGLAKVLSSLDVLNTTGKICLSKLRVNYESAKIAGFGDLYLNATERPLRLLESVLYRLDFICVFYYQQLFDGKTQTCAGADGIGLIKGDSGAPLFTTKNKHLILIAIGSWFINDDVPKKPSVFTRVNAYIDWIRRHTQNSCCIIDYSGR